MDGSVQRGSGLTRAVLALATIAALAYVGGFFGYGFFVGADEYLSGAPRATGCETPMSRFGWEYEAINYDIDDDARLLAENPDLTDCANQGAAAGDVLVASDGVALAGWFIPSAGPADESQPTVVLIHGGKSNKSGMLPYAPPFHDAFDMAIIDLRNSGRSDGAQSTGGLRERDDLRTLLDWLSEEKGAERFLLVGNSNGAGTALAEAWDDHRVEAVILDSMHASVERQIGNVIETERGLPAWPAALGLVQGVSAKVGEPLESVDPERTLRTWDARRILFTHGSADVIDRPEDSLQINVAVREATGGPYEQHVCDGAGHGRVVEVCAEEWADWVRAFVAETFPDVAGRVGG